MARRNVAESGSGTQGATGTSPSAARRRVAAVDRPARKASRRGGRTLSELESFTLGLIWQLGPCSPYDVRTNMRGSPSSQWSASTGAIYPLMRRLEKMGLVESRTARTGRRSRREYAITPLGMDDLRSWIGPPFPPEAVSVTYDPLRSRARFLAATTPSQRRAWLKESRAALDRIAEMVATWDVEHGRKDPFLSLLTRNGVLETEARRKWLAEMSEQLG